MQNRYVLGLRLSSDSGSPNAPGNDTLKMYQILRADTITPSPISAARVAARIINS